jgi:hypothetical protein
MSFAENITRGAKPHNFYAAPAEEKKLCVIVGSAYLIFVMYLWPTYYTLEIRVNIPTLPLF